MGMFDTIYNVPVKCPRCGDEEPKSVQFKCGPQLLSGYEFGKDVIEVDWTYESYNSVIDKDKKIIGGIADCGKCKKELTTKMNDLTEEARKKGELKVPEGTEHIFECEIGDENALLVILNRLDIDMFRVAITLNDDSVAMCVEDI